jgi:hypothetical protein
VHLLAQGRGGSVLDPAARFVADRADLGDDVHVAWIRGKGLVDDLVGDVGTVEVGGVDVRDAEFDGRAQHGDRLGPVGRRTEHPRPGQLHRTEPDPADRQVPEPVAAAGQ